jgi:hypothetical protein
LQQPSHFDQDGYCRRIVIGSGSERNRVVVSPQHNNVFRMPRTSALDNQVRRHLIFDTVLLALDRIVQASKLPFNVRSSGRETLRSAQMARTDNLGKYVHMLPQTFDEQ